MANLCNALGAVMFAGAVRTFLDSEGVAYDTAPSGEALAPDDVAAFTVLVECWN